jgi:hypothetical protein
MEKKQRNKQRNKERNKGRKRSIQLAAQGAKGQVWHQIQELLLLASLHEKGKGNACCQTSS